MFCKYCNTDKSESEFPRRGNGYRPRCKPCQNEYNKPFIKKSKKKNWKKYRDLMNKWERDCTEIIHYNYSKKKFLTDDEFLFEAKHRLLILKRTIKNKEHENV